MPARNVRSAKNPGGAQNPVKECLGKVYDLRGPQVEPGASFWMYCPPLRMVSIRALLSVTEKQSGGTFTNLPGWEAADIEKEIEELRFMSGHRDDPECIGFGHPSGGGSPISKFLNLRPPALGSVEVNRPPTEVVVRTGRGLARRFEEETPGISHHHALHALFFRHPWSPPRQALVWAALNITIASALQAAWFYKWLSTRPNTSRRPRPVECFPDLDVLYDAPDELRPFRTTCPSDEPGTPHHPAWPSGHSTYSAAASELLAFFFGNERAELEKLAANIGIARLWGGVHWRSDHVAGQRLGKIVARIVIGQLTELKKKGFEVCRQPPLDCPQDSPPSIETLDNQRKTFQCARGDEEQPYSTKDPDCVIKIPPQPNLKCVKVKPRYTCDTPPSGTGAGKAGRPLPGTPIGGPTATGS